MMKVKLLLSTTEMETILTMPTRDGRLSILTKHLRLEPRDSTRNSVSISTDHSISDPECQCKELLNATELTTFGSRDGERMSEPNNGTSMKSLRLSRTTTGRLTHLISNPTEDQAISDALLPTQDGGRCSDTKVPQLSTRKERSWKSKAMLILKTETLVSIDNKMVSGNNGTLSTLMNGRENQERENSMRNSV